ncbi:MAG: cobaltochelatase subunit CobN [Thauera sp.]|jgi:cobaltochelatase CobN|nr:cobaltochelatase subunit CobN [Thauera sp.]
MHLLAAQPGGFVDDPGIITRLEQTPADVVVLSAADTTLALLSAAWPQAAAARADFPSLRLANLLHLRQPASVDLYVDEVLQHARVIIIDHLGGESYWPYGTERIGELCRARGIALLMFSGDNSEDLNLLQKSTVPAEHCRELWRYLRAGGPANARAFHDYIAHHFFGLELALAPVRSLPPVAIYHPAHELATVADWQQDWQETAPCVIVLFYRAHLQAGNTAVFARLCERLRAHGLNPLPLALMSLKDEHCLATLQQLCTEHRVALILNTTAFALGALDDDGDHALAGDIPVLQLILAGNNQEAWQDDAHGLSPRDIAMHIALPEVDGRIITRAVSFKGLAYRCEHTQCDIVGYRPHEERINFVSELAQRWCRLRRLPNADKRLALILANYPGSDARLGNGVGLDTPASTLHILQQLQAAGYVVGDLPADGDALISALRAGITNDAGAWALRPAQQSLAMADYQAFFNRLPASAQAAVTARWGAPAADPMLRQHRFMIAGLRCGQIFVGIQPGRGYGIDLQGSYHDPELVPPHHYLAFYCWLRQVWASDAILHIGKHGNLEWLPGKSVALSGECWPDLIFGPMPHLYPFIVNDPGEGSQAKRRTQAVIIDHLMPPLTRAESYGPTRDLERMVDEYYEALMLDPRRADLLRSQILAHIVAHDLHRDLGFDTPRSAEEEQLLLNRTDAYLCELKEAQIRDGLHVFGHSPTERLRLDTLLALARHPVGDGRGARQGLTQALALDLALRSADEDFNPLNGDWAQPWQGAHPPELDAFACGPWRHWGDTRERLELFALQVLEQGLPGTRPWPQTEAVLSRIATELQPRLDACGEQEIHQLLQGLAGRFVPAGPSGAPSRGRPDVLPTGRNFFAVDTRTLPTRTSWELGLKSAALLVERYLQEEGDYPRAIGLSVWGTATMRTGGDDIAQAFALIGVRPKWADGSHRVSDFEILPMSLFDRPRIDVTLRISGFFRDAFANLIALFDAAVQAVAELDEPAEVNPIRARVLREAAELQAQGLDAASARRQAGQRIFGARPGSYGAGLQSLIDSGNWEDDADLAEAWLTWGGHAYGQHDYGSAAVDSLSRRLRSIDVVMQNQDNREHDLLDSDDYYQFQGGMSAAIRHLAGVQPKLYFGDHAQPQAPVVRSLEEEISRVVRSRVTNPKWIAGVKRHGYKGAFEMAATVDFLFAYDATARVVRDDQYARVADAYVGDEATRDFLRQHNPDALREICQRLREAIARGLWQDSADWDQRLQQIALALEDELEK